MGRQKLCFCMHIAKELSEKAPTFPERHRMCAGAKTRNVDFNLMIRMGTAEAVISVCWV